MLIRIDNIGALVIDTNYWRSDQAGLGVCYLSINAGAFRLLVPREAEAFVEQMRTARQVIVSRGPWPERHRDDAIEILFDDRTECPFAIQIGMESVDRLPLDADAAKQWEITVWIERGGAPRKALSRPCWYRRVPRIPWLKPMSDKE